jgi:hypothetical protein
MKVGDMVYHRDRDGIAAPLGDGLIVSEWEEWGVECNHEKPRWTVLWSTNAVFNHCPYELRVLHESR